MKLPLQYYLSILSVVIFTVVSTAATLSGWHHLGFILGIPSAACVFYAGFVAYEKGRKDAEKSVDRFQKSDTM